MTKLSPQVEARLDEKWHTGEDHKISVAKEGDTAHIHCSCGSTWSDTTRAMNFLIDRGNNIAHELSLAVEGERKRIKLTDIEMMMLDHMLATWSATVTKETHKDWIIGVPMLVSKLKHMGDNLKSLPQSQPRESDGKYTYTNFDLMCVCGHRLGLHLAEKPRACGTNGIGTFDCPCLDFRKSRKQSLPQSKGEV